MHRADDRLHRGTPISGTKTSASDEQPTGSEHPQLVWPRPTATLRRPRCQLQEHMAPRGGVADAVEGGQTWDVSAWGSGQCQHLMRRTFLPGAR